MLPRRLDTVSHILVVGLNDDGETISAMAMDDISHSLLVSNHEHHEIHEGSSYNYSDSISLNSGIVQDYLIITPNTDKLAHFIFYIDSIGALDVKLFEDTNRLGTTAQTTINANRNSSNIGTTLIYKDINGGTTDGNQIYTYVSGSVSKQTGTYVDHNSEIILKKNTKYLLRLISNSASNLINIGLSWYEHTSLPS